MATERIRYVDTGSAGGNGTTAALSGANAAYASLSAMVAAEAGNLVTADVWLHVYWAATGDVADTTALTINGFTLDATRYILIEAASGDRATASGWKTDRARLSIANANAVLIYDDYVYLDGMQIEVTGTNTNLQCCVQWANIAATNNLITLKNCRFRLATGGGYTSYVTYGGDADANINLYNCIATPHPSNAGTAHGYQFLGATMNVYNCLAYGFNRGYIYGAGTVNVYDSISGNNTDDFYGTWTGTRDTNASDDGDGDNHVHASGNDWTNEFTDPANGDFTLKATSTLIGAALGQGSGLFSTDIDGASRSDWDIGPHEYGGVSSISSSGAISSGEGHSNTSMMVGHIQSEV